MRNMAEKEKMKVERAQLAAEALQLAAEKDRLKVEKFRIEAERDILLKERSRLEIQKERFSKEMKSKMKPLEKLSPSLEIPKSQSSPNLPQSSGRVPLLEI